MEEFIINSNKADDLYLQELVISNYRDRFRIPDNATEREEVQHIACQMRELRTSQLKLTRQECAEFLSLKHIHIVVLENGTLSLKDANFIQQRYLKLFNITIDENNRFKIA